MVRLVLGPDGQVGLDLAHKAYGRGAWVHPAAGCLVKAIPRGLGRSFHVPVRSSVTEVWSNLRSAANRRAEALVHAGWRAGRVSVGATAAREAFERGAARLVIVAVDARAAAETGWVHQAVRAGLGLAWGTKESLGRATLRDEVAVAAVLDKRIATALSFAVEVAELPVPLPGSRDVLPECPTEDG